MTTQPNDDDKLKDFNKLKKFAEHPEQVFKSFKKRKDIKNRGNNNEKEN